MTDDTQERKHTPGPDIVIKALESAKAAVWDSHYGKGIDVGYAQNVSAEIDTAIAHTVTAVNAYEPMLEALKKIAARTITPEHDTRYSNGEEFRFECEEMIDEAVTAIALAEGKEGGAGE